VFPRDMVCLRNTRVDTLHKGDINDDDDDDDNNNNNEYTQNRPALHKNRNETIKYRQLLQIQQTVQHLRCSQQCC